MKQGPHLVQVRSLWRYVGHGVAKSRAFLIHYIEDDTVFAANADFSYCGSLAEFLAQFQFLKPHP